MLTGFFSSYKGGDLLGGFDSDIDMTQVAHACINAGDVSGGYTLVLLQQIRDELRELRARKVKE